MDDKNLCIGAHGEPVSQLKRVLNMLEYRILGVSNDFDEKTQSAVSAFQNDHGLRVDGVVDEKTWRALEKASAGLTNGMDFVLEEGEQRLSPEPQQASDSIPIPDAEPSVAASKEVLSIPSQNTSPASIAAQPDACPAEAEPAVKSPETEPPEQTGARVRLGASGDFVEELQMLLNQLGYLEKSIDGVFDHTTDTALRAFQHDHMQVANGIVGANTWRDLYAAVRRRDDVMQKPSLRLGSSGTYVRELQVKLSMLWFYSSPITGIFDELVEEAAREMQHTFNINNNGVVGPDTWKVLDNVFDAFTQAIEAQIKPAGRTQTLGESTEASKENLFRTPIRSVQVISDETLRQGSSDVAANVIQQASDLPANGIAEPEKPQAFARPHTSCAWPAAGKPVLRKGSTGVYVMQLQTRLKVLGCFDLSIDGVFGTKTADAVRRFQANQGITPDGIVGPITWAALDNPRIPSERVSPQYPELREGSTGADVFDLQAKLKALCYFTGALDGKFGPATSAAVRNFQQAVGLRVDGIVGPETRAALGSAGSAGQLAPNPVIREGDTGENVCLLQEKLAALGYFTGIATGGFGPLTTRAVKSFQSDHNLSANGIVCAKTWAALYAVTAPDAPVSGQI